MRNAADDSGLGCQGDEIEQLFFRRNRSNAFRHADAEIDDAAHRQFEGASARDDLAVIQRHRNIAIVGRAQFARECAVVAGGIGLHMVFRLRNDDAVDQHAGNL